MIAKSLGLMNVLYLLKWPLVQINPNHLGWTGYFSGFPYCGWNIFLLIVLLGEIHMVTYKMIYKKDDIVLFSRFPCILNMVFSTLLIVLIVLLMGPQEPFIYFSFWIINNMLELDTLCGAGIETNLVWIWINRIYRMIEKRQGLSWMESPRLPLGTSIRGLGTEELTWLESNNRKYFKAFNILEGSENHMVEIPDADRRLRTSDNLWPKLILEEYVKKEGALKSGDIHDKLSRVKTWDSRGWDGYHPVMEPPPKGNSSTCLAHPSSRKASPFIIVIRNSSCESSGTRCWRQKLNNRHAQSKMLYLCVSLIIEF